MHFFLFPSYFLFFFCLCVCLIEHILAEKGRKERERERGGGVGRVSEVLDNKSTVGVIEN